MKKYIAIEQSKEFFDFDLLVDDDGIRSAGGLNCEVFGISCSYPRDYVFLNEDLYKDIHDIMDDIVSEFDELTYRKEHWTKTEILNDAFYHSYKDIISDYLYDERYRKYSPKMVKNLKAFAENYGNDSVDDITEFLNITTGKEWVCKSYSGYSQGDLCYLIYCTEYHSDDYMELIGNAAVGAATEFCISENPIEIENRDIDDIIEEAREDCYYGIYLTDSDVWNEDKCKEKLAEYAECSFDEIAVITIENSYTVTKHNYKVA